MTIETRPSWDTPLKLYQAFIGVVLIVGAQIYTQGVKDNDNANTKAIVMEMRTQLAAGRDDATKKTLQDEIRNTRHEEFQAAVLEKLSGLSQRMYTLEHSRK